MSQNNKLLLLVLSPLLIGVSIFLISIFLPATQHGFWSPGNYYWSWALPVTACGMILSLFGVPILLTASYKDWSQKNKHWRWKMGLFVPVFLLGIMLMFPSGLFAILPILLSVFVFLFVTVYYFYKSYKESELNVFNLILFGPLLLSAWGIWLMYNYLFHFSM